MKRFNLISPINVFLTPKYVCIMIIFNQTAYNSVGLLPETYVDCIRNFYRLSTNLCGVSSCNSVDFLTWQRGFPYSSRTVTDSIYQFASETVVEDCSLFSSTTIYCIEDRRACCCNSFMTWKFSNIFRNRLSIYSIPSLMLKTSMSTMTVIRFSASISAVPLFMSFDY